MRTVDGSDGGGQLVRWALALSAVDGEAVEVEGIRGSRPNPGLRPQHLAVVRVLADATDATVEGATEGSERVEFDPGPVRPGEYAVGTGTAGSVALLFDAVLALAPALDGPLSVTATGGTDVKWSPPADYFRRVKLPLLWRAGVAASLDVERRGFYPAGGGRATLWIRPSEPALDLTDPHGVDRARVYATATADLAGADVAPRMARAAADRLAGAGVAVHERVVSTVQADSTGAVVAVRLDCGPVPAGFDALGEPGRPAEDVGEAAARTALEWRSGPGVVDPHMADQLVPFLALSGGAVAIPRVTDHVETGVALVRAFGYDVSVDRTGRVPTLRGPPE